VTGNFLCGVHGVHGWPRLGRGLSIGAASPGWASTTQCGRLSTRWCWGRHTALPDAPSIVDEEALATQERPEALNLEVQKAVTLLDAQLALLQRQVAVKIDLPAA
jgi:hypothetical protein